MDKFTLKTIKDAMATLGFNYAFLRFKSLPDYPYFVGEYSEPEPLTEDGLQESTFLLSAFHRGEWIDLESAKDAIAAYFPTYGKTFMAPDGSVTVIAFASALPIPTDDAELIRMQINLTIKQWKVIT